MGLLSNPSLMPRNKWVKILAKHHSKIYVICYFLSLIWFCCLAHGNFNHSTYLSENALSPGLVYPEIKLDSVRLLQKYASELHKERQKYKTNTPHIWIEEKMKEIGLETYVHEFSLSSPFHRHRKYRGKNVYGILRAPRASSTEGVVFSAPYRPPSSIHPDISASVPTLLAFADFARSKNYWSKDLIFLVTEEEHLGMFAFLEAYFNEQKKEPSSTSSSSSSSNSHGDYLNYGYLPARAGNLQAAVNLEIQDIDIDYINVKIEGLNGQLPNLDLFNVIQRIAAREGLLSGYKQQRTTKRGYQSTSSSTIVLQNMRNMITMLASQATGVPSGNHGFFHRYHIEAITLEGCVKKGGAGTTKSHSSTGYKLNVALSLLKTIEGVSRSLNNLLESFHQSYFFYILVQNERFISIGDYMPCLILLIVPLYTEAFLFWMMAIGGLNAIEHPPSKNNLPSNENDNDDDDDVVQCQGTNDKNDDFINQDAMPAITFMVGTGILGFCSRIYSMDSIQNSLFNYDLTIPQVITIITLGWNLLCISYPFIFKLTMKNLQWLHMICLLGLATTLVVLGVLNFALAYLIALICLPLALLINSNCLSRRKQFLRHFFTIIYTFLLNPLITISILVICFAFHEFPNESFRILMKKCIDGLMETITLGLVDNLIYNNWLLSIISFSLLPLWCGFWAIAIKSYHLSHQCNDK